jgi:hypothetical protein
MNAITIKSENISPDKDTIEAQKRWQQDGTVTDKYLKRALGDISHHISILPAKTKPEGNSKKRRKS